MWSVEHWLGSTEMFGWGIKIANGSTVAHSENGSPGTKNFQARKKVKNKYKYRKIW